MTSTAIFNTDVKPPFPSSGKVLVMLTMRCSDGHEWTYGRAVEAVDDVIEMEVRGDLLREFLAQVRDSDRVLVC